MKTLIGLLAMVATSYSLSANALLTKCHIDYRVRTVNLLAEVGFLGKGQAVCQDVTGQTITVPLNVQMVGAGLKAGVCKASGSIDAVGVGFEFAELLGAIGKAEIGPVNGSGATMGLAAKATPFGVNAQLAVSQTSYSGACIGLGDAQGLLMTQDLDAAGYRYSRR